MLVIFLRSTNSDETCNDEDDGVDGGHVEEEVGDIVEDRFVCEVGRLTGVAVGRIEKIRSCIGRIYEEHLKWRKYCKFLKL